MPQKCLGVWQCRLQGGAAGCEVGGGKVLQGEVAGWRASGDKKLQPCQEVSGGLEGKKGVQTDCLSPWHHRPAITDEELAISASK